jgi:hypothetical protein
MTLAVCSLLWDANQNSRDFSAMYSEEWVERLYLGFERNLTQPFEFILYTDRIRQFSVPVSQVSLRAVTPDYGHCILPYKMGRPMILVGLDTIVTGNIDHLAEYCMTADHFACPRDPYYAHQVCNGVALVPAGMQRIGFEWAGANDMEHVRKYNPRVIDDLFPGQVVSYKGSVKKDGLGDARIVYFHGEEKPHQLTDLDWISEHWQGEDMAERNRYVMSVKGEPAQGMGGWKDRQEAAIRKSSKFNDPARIAMREERARAAAAAAGHVAPAPAPVAAPVAEPVAVEVAEPVAVEVAELVAEVAEATEEEPAPEDDLTVMTLEDLRAYYELVFGGKPHHLKKRETLEREIREATMLIDESKAAIEEAGL